MSDVQQTLIDFLRHGEPVGGRRYRGDGVDDPLSEKGWDQMWRSVGGFSGWDHILSSPMQRCRAFAEALSDKHGIALSVEPDLREIGMGAWEGRSPLDIRREDPGAYAAFYRDPVNARPAGCEPLDRFGRRVARVYERMLEQFRGRHVLAVAHAGVIRAAVGHVLRADPCAWYRLCIDNGGMTRLEFHNRSRI
jgi:broad specificity phosphatase PhoE